MKSFFFLMLTASLHAQPVIGSIGEITLTTADLKELLTAAEQRAGQPLETDTGSLNTFIRANLVQKLVLEKAKAADHDKLPQVTAELDRARDSALVESFLRTSSTPPDSYPSEAEISAFYEQNKASFLVPKSWKLAQIFVSDNDPAITEAAKAKLDDIVKQLADPTADFASVARVSSDEPASAANGGELGWLQDNLIQPAIRDALPTLKLNENSKPIRLDDGWHIIRLLDTQEARTPLLAELSERIKITLRANKTRENRDTFLADLLRETPPAVNEIELLKLK